MSQKSDDEALNPRKAAKYLDVSWRTLQVWRKQRTGPKWSKIGYKTIRYRREDLDSFLLSKQEGAETKTDTEG